MRLNGWRRLWVVWTILSLPMVFVGVARLKPFPSEWEYWFEERGRASEAASRRAYERIGGAQINQPPIDPKTGGPDVDEYVAKLGRVRKQLLHDDQLRAEIKKIDAEFDPKLDQAFKNDRNLYWMMVGVVWALLVGSAYGVGATVAWIRRGFNGGGR